MPRYVTISFECDWEGCGTVGVEGDGAVTPMTVALDGKAVKEFLICAKHRQQIEDAVLPLMAKGVKVAGAASNGTGTGGHRAATAAATKGEFVCQVDECGRTLKGRAGMAQHCIRTHGFESLAAYEQKYGITIATG